jgi:hypothetical protein
MGNILPSILKCMFGKNMTKMSLPVNTTSFLKQKVISNCQNKDKTGKPKFDFWESRRTNWTTAPTTCVRELIVGCERSEQRRKNRLSHLQIDHRDSKKLHVYRKKKKATTNSGYTICLKTDSSLFNPQATPACPKFATMRRTTIEIIGGKNNHPTQQCVIQSGCWHRE